MSCVNRLPLSMEKQKSANYENSNSLSKQVVVIYFPRSMISDMIMCQK